MTPKKKQAKLKRGKRKHPRGRKAPPKPSPSEFEFVSHPDVGILQVAQWAASRLGGIKPPSARAEASREAENRLMERLGRISETKNDELVIQAVQALGVFRKYDAQERCAALTASGQYTESLSALATMREELAKGSDGVTDEQIKALVMHHAVPLMAGMVDEKIAEAKS